MCQDHRSSIKNVSFGSEEDRQRFNGVIFLVEAELDDISDETMWPKVIEVRGEEVLEIAFEEFEIPDTRIEIPFPFRHDQSAFDHFYDFVQRHLTDLLANGKLIITGGEYYLAIGNHRVRGEVMGPVEEDELTELQETFGDCALTEDEAEALGFGSGPHLPV